jgi:putative methyltransferase
MSLYHEAAAILDKVNKGKTSLKAEIFGKKTWKTDGKTLFALTSEAAKWSSILAEVVEKSGLLKIEKQVRFIWMNCYSSRSIRLTPNRQNCRLLSRWS